MWGLFTSVNYYISMFYITQTSQLKAFTLSYVRFFWIVA